MAPQTTLAALLLLLIASSCLAEAVSATSMVQKQRKLLANTWRPTAWGIHHHGEKCHIDYVGRSLTKGVLRQIIFYVDAQLNILCLDVAHAELKGVHPLHLVVNVPLKTTNHCAGFAKAGVYARVLDLNRLGNVHNVLRTAQEKVALVKGIVDNNGKGALKLIYVELNSGRKYLWGQVAAVGLPVEIKLGFRDTLGDGGFFSKYCLYGDGIGLLEFVKAK